MLLVDHVPQLRCLLMPGQASPQKAQEASSAAAAAAAAATPAAPAVPPESPWHAFVVKLVGIRAVMP
jgi:hypothetical protein